MNERGAHDPLIDLIDSLVLARAERSPNEDPLLSYLFRDPSNGDRLTPDDLYRHVGRDGPPDDVQMVAAPYASLETPLRPGDLLLRTAFAEGGKGHVAAIGEPTLWCRAEASFHGFEIENGGPGLYAHVIESGSFPHTSASGFARKILDSQGRMPACQMLLRPAWRTGEANGASQRLDRFIGEERGDDREEDTPKLTVATAWINTYEKGDCHQKQLDHCDDVANGFGGMMEAAGHQWAIKLKEKEAKPADWLDKMYGGADDTPGRGADTVDFAMLVSHGGIRPATEKTPLHVTVTFNQPPCRLVSHHTRFGDGQLKWLVLDSCRSLHLDRKANITPDAIWRKAFDGLHAIFGFTGTVSDGWWTEDRGGDFAMTINLWHQELAEAWLDAASSVWIDDTPMVLYAGRDSKDARKRLNNETLSSGFDSLPASKVTDFAYEWRS